MAAAVKQIDTRSHDDGGRAMTDAELQTFAEVLRVQRAKLRMDKVSFCKLVGLSPNTLRALERGAQQPAAGTLLKLTRVLKLSSQELRGRAAGQGSDPLLQQLNEEDLDVAQAFHHAPLRVRHQVLAVLHHRHEFLTHLTVEQWSTRLLALSHDQRQVIVDVIREFERPGSASDLSEAEPAGASAPRTTTASARLHPRKGARL